MRHPSAGSVRTSHLGRRATTWGVAAAIGVSAFFGAPAAASDISTDTAPLDETGYDSFVEEVIQADEAINSIAQDGDGNVVVRADFDDLAPEAAAELATYDNVVLIDDEPILALAANDVVGGAGYAIDRAGLCSFGFSAWSPSGRPAIITAGHCGDRGQRVERTRPSRDDAPFSPGSSPGEALWADPAGRDVGTFAFSQWGGPNGSPGANRDVTSVDIAAIDVTNAALRLRPAVTDWTTARTDDLSVSTIPVTAVGEARVGDTIVRSGRTTGMRSGTVLEVRSWTRVCERISPVPVGCHWVYGFRTDAASLPGDSGGAFLRGTTALGVLSGGGGGTSFAADLSAGLAVTGGYTIQLAVSAPTVAASAADVAEQGRVWGSGEPGATLIVDRAGVVTEVPIGSDGAWSFDAPEDDRGAITLTVSRGYDTSDSVIVE